MRRLIISEQDGVLFNSPFNSGMCSTYVIYTKEIRRMVRQQGEGFWIQFVTSFRSYAVSNHGTDDISVPIAEEAFIDMLRMLSSDDNLLQLSDLVISLKALNRALLDKNYDVVMNPMLRYLYTRFSKPFFTIKLYFRFFTSFMTLFHRWEGSRRARSSSPLASWIPPVHWTDLKLFRNYGRNQYEMFLKAGWGKMLPKLLRLTKSQICWLEPEGNFQQKCRGKKHQCRKMKPEASQGKDRVLPKTTENTGNNAGSASAKSEGPEVSVEYSSGAIGKVHPQQQSVRKGKMSYKEKNDLDSMENISEPSGHSEGRPRGKKAMVTNMEKGNNKKEVEKLDEKSVRETSLQNASCHFEGSPHGKKATTINVKKGNNKKQIEKLDEKCVKEASLRNVSSNEGNNKKEVEKFDEKCVKEASLQNASCHSEGIPHSKKATTLNVKKGNNKKEVEKLDEKCVKEASLQNASCDCESRAHGKKATTINVKNGNNKKEVEKLDEKCVKEASLQNVSSNEGNNKKEVEKLDEKCVMEASLQNVGSNDVTKNKASDSSESQNESTWKTTSRSSGCATLDVNSNIIKNPVPCKDNASKTDEVRKQSVKSRSQPVKTNSTSANCGGINRRSMIFTRSKPFEYSNNESVLANKVGNLTNGITTNIAKTRVEKVHGNENIAASNLVSADDDNNLRTLYPDDVNNNVDRKNTVGWCKETMCSSKESSNEKDILNGHAKINHSSPASCTETISQTKLKKPFSMDESDSPKLTSVNVLQDKGDTVDAAGKFLGKEDNKRSFSNDLHDGSYQLSSKEAKHESTNGYLSKDCSSKGKGALKEDQKREIIANEGSIYPTLYHDNEEKAQLKSHSTGEEDSLFLTRRDSTKRHVETQISGKESSQVSSGDSCNVAHTSAKSETKNEIIKNNDFKEPSSSAAHVPGKQSNSKFETFKVPSNRIKHLRVKNGEDTQQKRTIENSDSVSKKGSTDPKPKGQPEDPCPKEKVYSCGSSYGRPLPPPRCSKKMIYLYRKCDTCNILEHTPNFYKRCSWCIREGADRPKVYCGEHCQYVDWVRAHKKDHKSS